MTEAQKVEGITVRNRHMTRLCCADDTLLFLNAYNINISNGMTLLTMYGDASDLHLNVSKSTLMIVSTLHNDSFIWRGKRIQIGCIFRYLGYPLGVHVSNKALIDWVMDRVCHKIDYWKAAEWHLHVRLQIVKDKLIP